MEVNMKRMTTTSWLLINISGLFLLMNSVAAAHEKVVVVPLGGAVGDATLEDVIQGKTFSSKEGKGLSGTLTQLHTINGDGTVTDNLSGLMWQQADDGILYNWYEAAGVHHINYNPGSTDACGSLNLGGYLIGSWRLPTKDELKGLVRCSDGASTPLPDYTLCGYSNPTIDVQYLCKSDFYWSSSTYDADYAWYVYFYNGFAYWYNRPNNGYVRCVR